MTAPMTQVPVPTAIEGRDFIPRKPRESSGTGIYHVMLRGINRQDIFDDTEDYWTFIKMMSAVPCYIYAYCLMPNHVHLLIAEKSLKVGEVEDRGDR